MLHTLRCIGFASEERIVSVTAMEPQEVGDHLRSLEVAGLVEHLLGDFGGWGLSDPGREADREGVAAELESTGARPAVAGCYRSFLELNPVVLGICGDWQMRKLGSATVVNDHDDPDYDSRVLSRLMRVDDEAQAICADLASVLVRFDGYGRRLEAALRRVMAGDHSLVADTLDSYHTVWFQLHEDLLATLGISREDERQRNSPTDGQ